MKLTVEGVRAPLDFVSPKLNPMVLTVTATHQRPDDLIKTPPRQLEKLPEISPTNPNRHVRRVLHHLDPSRRHSTPPTRSCTKTTRQASCISPDSQAA